VPAASFSPFGIVNVETVERLLLKPADAAKALAIGKRKLWELTNRTQIPHLRFGKNVRYGPTWQAR
jgi:hypothetical protein